MKKYIAEKYNSRRFPHSPFNSVAYKDDAMIDSQVVMAELTNMRAALELKLKDEADTTKKNIDEKLEAVNKTITDLKAVKPEVTADELKAIKNDLDVTVKALDIVQERVKSQSMKSGGYHADDDSFISKLNAGVMELKNNIYGDQIKGGKFVTKIQLKAVGDMTVTTNVSTGVVPNTYRNGYVTPPFEMVHMRDIVTVTPSETDSYHFYRFSIGEGNIEFQTNENTQKAQIDDDLTEQVVNLNYLAGWMDL